jgi:hypothetical protein
VRARDFFILAAVLLLAWRVLHLELRLAGAEALAWRSDAASVHQTVNVTLCRFCAQAGRDSIQP